MERFADRTDAGRRLAAVWPRDAFPDLVLGLPRGGVVVAAELAGALGRPLDVLVVRKLGAPGRPELGMGAVAEGGVRVVNEELVASLEIDDAALQACTQAELLEVDRRLAVYVGDRVRTSPSGRRVALVDDGLATGYTALAAVHSVRRGGAREVVLAVPVASREAAAMLAEVTDALVCLAVPRRFGSVGNAYLRFDQASDEEVVSLLRSRVGS